MRNAIVALSLILFGIAVMCGSWMILVAGPGDAPDRWSPMPFRTAMPLGTRSFIFSLPLGALCLAFRNQLWPEPLTTTSVLRNALGLLIAGLILGRINLATF